MNLREAKELLKKHGFVLENTPVENVLDIVFGRR